MPSYITEEQLGNLANLAETKLLYQIGQAAEQRGKLSNLIRVTEKDLEELQVSNAENERGLNRLRDELFRRWEDQR